MLPVVGVAQTSFYTDRAVGTFPALNGGVTMLVPIQYGQVRVCRFPAIGSPCVNTADGFVFDLSGGPLTVIGGNFGQVRTDVTGRFSFGCTPGTYQVQVAASSNNVPQLSYPITCPIPGNSPPATVAFGLLTASTVNGGCSAAEYTGSDLGVKITAAEADGNCRG